MITTSGNVAPSAFKRAQIRYRRQGADPNRTDDFSEFIDFSNPQENNCIVTLTADQKGTTESEPLYEGSLFGLSSFPGFVYAPQALSKDLQRDIAFLSVSQYCESPHRTNIDLIPPRQGIEEVNAKDNMWDLWKQEHGFAGTDQISKKDTLCEKKKYRCFKKLSWSTMGYHYDWTARAYREGAKSPVPSPLENLAAAFARTSLRVTNASTSPQSFTGSACIVNYYNTKSIMGGHRDDLEFALDKPVVSISVGLPGVYLLGGNTKEDAVVPILVRPGDVMMLGGKSRLCYHGMSRVIPATVSLPSVSEKDASAHMFTRFESGDVESNASATVPRSDRDALQSYLTQYRININVRQVLVDGVDSIPNLI